MNNSRLIEDIKSALDISDIIGQYTSLRRTRRGYSGLCPFHDEKTPSFHVYTDSQSYYCFSCHEAGDIFTFVMKKNGLTFQEAIELLASRAGINPESYGHHQQKRARTLYDVMSMADEFYRGNFVRLPGGKAYIERRGITVSEAESFGLGYATDSWDGLIQAMSAKGIGTRELVDAGLIIEGQKGFYDRFRGRVIFPVRDISGRIIAFGGRAVVQDTGAKYINSPETEIYHKRNNLYLLNTASSQIRQKGYSILCEGYMDALRLHKCGFRESAASLGTSLTAEQAVLLKRFADRCYICYDGDSAGRKAALRGMYILAENGLDVRIVRLPDGQDPDDFLRANPPESFRRALKDALPLIPYHVETLKPELDDPLRRKKALNDLWEGVKRVKPDDSAQYVASLSQAFRIPTEEMRKRIFNGAMPSDTPKFKPEPELLNIDGELECALCASLMRYRECRLRVKPGEIYGLLTNPDAQITAEAMISGNPEDALNIWRTTGDSNLEGIIARGEICLDEMRVPENEKWQHVYSGLEKLRIERRIREIEEKFSSNTATNDDLREISELRRKLQELKI
ncbi:MAG: DNA primase [Synergistaceae bacterium]|nr:DNA primase [Synergistaceae bacterium]